jgi:hypothetical protein
VQHFLAVLCTYKKQKLIIKIAMAEDILGFLPNPSNINRYFQPPPNPTVLRIPIIFLQRK